MNYHDINDREKVPTRLKFLVKSRRAFPSIAKQRPFPGDGPLFTRFRIYWTMIRPRRPTTSDG